MEHGCDFYFEYAFCNINLLPGKIFSLYTKINFLRQINRMWLDMMIFVYIYVIFRSINCYFEFVITHHTAIIFAFSLCI